MDLSEASDRLSQIELLFSLDGMPVHVLWFSRMLQTGSWLIRRHAHSSFEFHLIAAGACRVRLDGGEFVACGGEFYLTAPRVFHEQSAYGNDGYTEYCLNVDLGEAVPETEGAALRELFSRACCRPVPDHYGGMRYFDEALREALEQRLGYYTRLKSLVSELLVAFARALGRWEQDPPRYYVPHKAAGNERRFEEIQSFVEENISAPLKESDLSNHIYLSGKQIDRIVRRSTGKSTRRYINSVRLEKAKALLLETPYSLSDIAARLGFTSEYYFNQFFKREVGLPPGVYRKNVRKT